MKKLLFIAIFLLIHTFSFSQSKYPRYEKDSSGNSVVVLTVEQVRKIDNNLDLLRLFEKLNSQIIQNDTIYLKVLSEKDKIIHLQSIQILDLKKSLFTKDERILNLENSTSQKDSKISNLDQIIVNKDKEINLRIEETKRAKTNYLIGGGLGGIIIGIVIRSFVQ